MTSKVFLRSVEDWSDSQRVAQHLTHLLEASHLLDGIAERALVAIKLTFGEAGNRGHAPVPVVRALVTAVRRRGGSPFLTETNTLYNGRRKNAVDHLEVAREHGFTQESVGAPIILGDGVRGRESFDVEVKGRRVGCAHLAPVVRDVDFLIALSHLTGHLVEGFGGALKNLGMGLAARAGKLDQHSAVSPSVKPQKCTRCLACLKVCPVNAISDTGRSAAIDGDICIGCAECLAVCPAGAIVIDWSRESTHVQEATVEYALAVQRALGGRLACVNLLNHISRHCDCMGETPDLVAPDIGIAASVDPVALDQASVEQANRIVGRDVFREAWPEVDPEVQLRHAEQIGLGSRAHELIEVPAAVE